MARSRIGGRSRGSGNHDNGRGHVDGGWRNVRRGRAHQGGRHRRTRLVEGGIDRARGTRESLERHRARRHRRGAGRRHTHRLDGDAREDRGPSADSSALRCARRGRREFREPADPKCGDHRRKPAATAPLLVFPLLAVPLFEKGRGSLLRASPATIAITQSSTTGPARLSTHPARRRCSWR